jgi:ureidoacrylate peracid hydrolase
MGDWKMKGKPALVILHMQQGIVGEGGNIPGLFEAVKETGIIPRQQALLRAFRDRKLPVVFLRALHVTSQQNPAGVLPAYGNLFRLIELAQPTPNNLEIIPELVPQPEEPVLTNWIIGAFTNSGLDQVLRAHGAETLVMAGCITHVAVYTAALQAVDLLYSVIVPSDACASPSSQAEAQEVVLKTMMPNIALVTSTEDVIAHL